MRFRFTFDIEVTGGLFCTIKKLERPRHFEDWFTEMVINMIKNMNETLNWMPKLLAVSMNDIRCIEISDKAEVKRGENS